MSNAELQQMFDYCKWLSNPEEWMRLGLAYYERGYMLNALYCFEQAETCQMDIEHD